LGDPMEVRLGDFRLSLRRREAARVQVHPFPDAGK
jgi:Fe2+ transport system protein FeoA